MRRSSSDCSRPDTGQHGRAWLYELLGANVIVASLRSELGCGKCSESCLKHAGVALCVVKLRKRGAKQCEILCSAG